MKFRIKGFTLLELLVVLSLVSILLLGTLGSYRYFLQKNTMLTLENKLTTAIQYARVTAISMNRSVYLGSFADKGDWNTGVALYDALTHEILYEWHWAKSSFLVRFEGFGSGEHLKIAANPLHAASNGQIIIQDTSNGQESRLVVNRMGRTRIEHNKQ